MIPTSSQHAELVVSLADHFRAAGNRMVWTEQGLGSRYLNVSELAVPDVLTIHKTFTSRAISIYEVKASVADFRADMTSGKWCKYLPLCTRFYFATPQGLITRKDLPGGVGWVTRTANGWSSVRAALYRPDDGRLDEHQWLALLIYLANERRLVRDLADRLAMVSNMEHYGWSRSVSARLSQAADAAGRATRASRAEETRYRRLIDHASSALGLSPEALANAIHSRNYIRATVQGLTEQQRIFLRETGQGLLDIARSRSHESREVKIMTDKPDWKLKPAAKVSEAALQLLCDVRDEHHADLNSFSIELWFWAEATTKAGRPVWGRAALPNQRERISRGVDGIITLAWDWWQTATGEQRRCVLDHELSHFDLKDEDDLDKGLKTVGHDLEEFVSVYKRHGAVLEDMQQFEAAVQGSLPGMDEEVSGDGRDDTDVTIHAGGQEPVHTTVAGLQKVAEAVGKPVGAVG